MDHLEHGNGDKHQPLARCMVSLRGSSTFPAAFLGQAIAAPTARKGDGKAV